MSDVPDSNVVPLPKREAPTEAERLLGLCTDKQLCRHAIKLQGELDEAHEVERNSGEIRRELDKTLGDAVAAIATLQRELRSAEDHVERLAAERDAAVKAISDGTARIKHLEAAATQTSSRLIHAGIPAFGWNHEGVDKLAAERDGLRLYAEVFARLLVKHTTGHTCIDNDDGTHPKMGPPWAKSFCWECETEVPGDVVQHTEECVVGKAQAFLASRERNK